MARFFLDRIWFAVFDFGGAGRVGAGLGEDYFYFEVGVGAVLGDAVGLD